MPLLNRQQSIRQKVSLSELKFDVTTLPKDLLRVYYKLKEEFGEDYALVFVFSVRTGSELHRAWHMTLLTSKILQQIKDKYQMRMTWELGVIKLKFRVEDGGYELHRKVPYDYDSEFQDLYMKIAVALIEDHINIHQALIFQSETKHGVHTAKSGNFLRAFPGRLVLYPIEAATCAVIFFGGDFLDSIVAAICGLAAGLIEYALVTCGGEAKVLIDVLVGTSTGVIGALFFRFNGESTCLPAVFLGTLYWFFYGTAFVIGILEIVGGELETGVIRFMAVSVKTFVLTLGATFGMKLVLTDPNLTPLQAWSKDGVCGLPDLDNVPWRIPLYLFCSASALGQYRFPIAHYWRGLAIQLVGYEIQYQALKEFQSSMSNSNLDVAASNVLAAAGSVVAACLMSYIVDKLSFYYNARLLQREHEKFSVFGEIMFNFTAGYVRLLNCLKIGRKSDLSFLQMSERLSKESRELSDPTHSRTEIQLTGHEERLLTEAVISAEDLNIWALLMPTVYQLVPGSLIARLWFNAVFPVQSVAEEKPIEGSSFFYTVFNLDQGGNAVFADLMVTATTLALGLLLGMGFVNAFAYFFRQLVRLISCGDNPDISDTTRARLIRRQSRYGLLGSSEEDDPDDDKDGTDYSVASSTNGSRAHGRKEVTFAKLTAVEETKEEMNVCVPLKESRLDGTTEDIKYIQEANI